MEKILQPLSSVEDIKAAQQAAAPQPAPAPVAPAQPAPAVAVPDQPAAVAMNTAQPAPVQPAVASAPAQYPDPVQSASISAPASDEYSAHFGVAASSNPTFMQQAKPHLPVGVYIVAGLSILGLLFGFVFDGETSAIYWIVTVVQLLLAVGLLLRNNFARVTFVVIAVLGIIATGITVFRLMSLQDRSDQLYHKTQIVYGREKEQLHGNVPAEMQQQMQQLDAEEQQVAKLYTQAYIREGLEIGFLAVEAVYLTLPGVKRAFT